MNFDYYNRSIRDLLVIVLLSAGMVFSTHCSAMEAGITESTIVVGQSCALSGPSEDLGKKMNAGIISAFEQRNVRGGVNGRTIRLITKDDFYEPGQAIKNTEALIHNEKVFALIGEVGTPTSRVVVPITQKEKVPFIAPFTGARFLRLPVQSHVINIRAGYDEETLKIITYLVQEKGLNQIACFYQDDSFGLSGLMGVRSALSSFGLAPVAEETYQRNTVAVMGGFLRIKELKPQAVVLVGSYQPCAEFIKLSRAKGLENAVMATLSFAGTQSLLIALRDSTGGVIISQVMPSPLNNDLEIVKNYQEAMATFQPEQDLSYISFEGYIAGRFFIRVLESIGEDLTRDNFIRHIERQRLFTIEGITLTFGPTDHQGMDTTYLTIIRDGKIVPLGER